VFLSGLVILRMIVSCCVCLGGCILMMIVSVLLVFVFILFPICWSVVIMVILNEMGLVVMLLVMLNVICIVFVCPVCEMRKCLMCMVGGVLSKSVMVLYVWMNVLSFMVT